VRFDYRSLEGLISDERTPSSRYTCDFTVDSTPVRLVGDPATVLSIAKWRQVIVIGRASLTRTPRFVTYYLRVPDTGVTLKANLAVPVIALMLATAALFWIPLSGARDLLVLLPFCLAGVPLSALLAFDAYHCNAVALSLGLGSNNRWRGP
jgi:hypothetical protein